MKRLGDIINIAVDQKEILRAARAQAVSRQWIDVVGELLATKTSPDRFERGTLWVCATSTTWAQELRMREETVLQRLNELSNEKALFTEIRVGVGPRRRDLMD